MDRRFGILLVFLQVVPFLSGCGTMANLQGQKLSWNDEPEQVPPKPFGGVDRDIGWISTGAVYFTADIPFSLVGDVVSLPRVLKKPDPFQEEIRKGENLENQGWLQYRKIKPDVVLKKIPVGTPVEQAKSFMEKHGFTCSYDSTEWHDEKPTLRTGNCLTCVVLRPLCYLLLAGQRVTVTLFYREGLVTDAEVMEHYSGI